eukprot:6046717-Amphidinium_carterae.4
MKETVRRKEAELLEQRREELEQATGPIAPRLMSAPEEPSPLERAQHELTHIPARRWCELCQMGRGQADAHYSISWDAPSRDKPQVSMDFNDTRRDRSWD